MLKYVSGRNGLNNNAPKKGAPMVTLDDFKKMELVVAEITEVKDHPNADKLYVLKVNTGKEDKQLVAGIRQNYTKEELTGRKIVVINNLEEATIRGEVSQGMLLAAQDDTGIRVLQPDADVKTGSPVR